MSSRTRHGGNANPEGGGDGGEGPAAGAAAAGEAPPDIQQLILTALQATTNALDGLGTALQNLPADMVAAMPAPPPPAPAAPAAPAVDAPPAAVQSSFRAAGANVLDFHSNEGKKFYEQATLALFASNNLFEVEPTRFHLFLNRLNEQAHNLGMLMNGSNTMIPPDAANPAAGTPINLINGHGGLPDASPGLGSHLHWHQYKE